MCHEQRVFGEWTNDMNDEYNGKRERERDEFSVNPLDYVTRISSHLKFL